jgi:hypothetical protein
MAIKPHTREWFEALEKLNPQQAAMTRAAIKVAGRNDVCSFCGDVGSMEYRIVGAKLETARLCDDCIKMRAVMHGEKFEPLLTAQGMRRTSSVDKWLALPELPMGTYQVHNIGWLEANLVECRSRGVLELPLPGGDEEGLVVRLPNVEIVQGAKPVMYRLPTMFGSIVKQMHEDAGRWHRDGRRFLPATFRFARAPDGSAVVQPSDGLS